MSRSADESSAFAERTVLAWQRTSLAILTMALLQMRFTAGAAPPVVLALIGFAGILAVVAAVESRRRDRGGRVGLVLAVAVAMLGSVELGLVLAHVDR